MATAGISVVALDINCVDDKEPNHTVELNISEARLRSSSTSSLPQNFLLNPDCKVTKRPYKKLNTLSASKNRLTLRNCSYKSLQYQDGKKTRKITSLTGNDVLSLYRKRSPKTEVNKDTEKGIFPAKIASRKIVDQLHFDQYKEKRFPALIKNDSLIKQETDNDTITLSELIVPKEEIICGDLVCDSTVKIEYGSGVNIYETVQTYDSDQDSEGKNDGRKCNRCKGELLNERDLSFHKSSAHERTNNWFQCKLCGSNYQRAYTYYCHLGSHDSRFTCISCKRTFVRVTGLKKHLKQCHKVSNASICVVCGVYFENCNRLDDHLQEKHPKEAESLRCYFKQCIHCRYQFMTENSYVNHNKNAPYKCRKCDEYFQCNNRLVTHLNFKHRSQVCQECGKKFDALDKYMYHVRYYHVKKHLKCPYCDKHFRVRSRLLIHIDVNHTDGHNYKCNQCEYTAKNYASVNRHRRVAHMPKSETHKNICKVCGKMFLVLSKLKVHMKSHSNNRPHVCQMCGRGYKFKYLLNKHQKDPDSCLRILFPNGTRMERKGKRRCDLCSIDFAAPEQLALHMVQVHNVNIETRDVNTHSDKLPIATNFAQSVISKVNGSDVKSGSSAVLINKNCQRLESTESFALFADNIITAPTCVFGGESVSTEYDADEQSDLLSKELLSFTDSAKTKSSLSFTAQDVTTTELANAFIVTPHDVGGSHSGTLVLTTPTSDDYSSDAFLVDATECLTDRGALVVGVHDGKMQLMTVSYNDKPSSNLKNEVTGELSNNENNFLSIHNSQQKTTTKAW